MAQWGVVLPSNRPERVDAWLRGWQASFDTHGVRVYIVRDEPPWDGIPDWVPRRTDAIRSWGLWQAYAAGCDRVLTLDDDVYPVGEGVFWPYDEAFDREYPVSASLSVGALTGTGLEMRGWPRDHYDPERDEYLARIARPWVQYGGWNGVPDLDAETQAEHPEARSAFLGAVLAVPVGSAITTCSMNMAMDREALPFCWQLTVRGGLFDRWCDIWSGLIQKRVLDEVGRPMLINGRAKVYHSRASDPTINAAKEGPGYAVNAGLWDYLQGSGVRGDAWGTWYACIEALGYHAVCAYRGDQSVAAWRDELLRARDQWARLFRGADHRA